MRSPSLGCPSFQPEKTIFNSGFQHECGNAWGKRTIDDVQTPFFRGLLHLAHDTVRDRAGRRRSRFHKRLSGRAEVAADLSTTMVKLPTGIAQCSFKELSIDNESNFLNFQVLLLEALSTVLSYQGLRTRLSENPMILGKRHGRLHRHDVPKLDVRMNARPQIREKLIELKIRHWCNVAQCPLLARGCPSARARKNYWRLCARYPAIMKRLGLSESSVYR